MKTCAFIFARGGSKGVPRKNIRPLAGVPLIAHSIQMAKSIPDFDGCFLSTDNSEIAEIGRRYGAVIIPRPIELAQDDSPEWLSWQHAIRWVENVYGPFDKFVSLPATAPLRTSNNVMDCISALEDGVDIVLTMTESNRSPWFNMVTVDVKKNLSLVMRDKNAITRRQDSPVTYDLSTVAYVARPKFIKENSSIWAGSVRGVLVSQENAVDIDNEFDFKIAEILMQERVNDMEGKSDL